MICACARGIILRKIMFLIMASWSISISVQAAPHADASAKAALNTAVPAPNAVIKGELNMKNQVAWNLYVKYLSAWNSDSIETRLKLAAEILIENFEYQTVRHDLCTGQSQVIEDMATFHEKFPGGHFEIGDVSSHHNVALVTWVIIQADGKEFARGHDQLTIDRDGKISKIITFGPSVKNPN